MYKWLILPVLTLGLIAVTTAPPLMAQGRPDIRRMSCDRAQDLVEDHGAIVMTTGRHTYERIVRHRGYCDHDENVRRVRARSRDNSRCFVGYKCVPEYIIRHSD